LIPGMLTLEHTRNRHLREEDSKVSGRDNMYYDPRCWVHRLSANW
jgi:hypothetical protein